MFKIGNNKAFFYKSNGTEFQPQKKVWHTMVNALTSIKMDGCTYMELFLLFDNKI